MRRDDDLIRALMFEAEDKDDWHLVEAGAVLLSPSPEQNARAYNLIYSVMQDYSHK